MEYQRTKNGVGDIFQWVDGQLCIIMDVATGNFSHLEDGAIMGTQEQCLARVEQLMGWENRLVIVKLDCIRAFKVEKAK